jgi:hypothetical protein
LVLTNAGFHLVRDLPKGHHRRRLGELRELLRRVNDQEVLVHCLRHPSAQFVSWLMGLVVSEQILKCAPFFKRTVLLDAACELVDDVVAIVTNDEVMSIGELKVEGDLWIVEDLAGSGNHRTRLCSAQLFQRMRLELAICGKEVVKKLIGGSFACCAGGGGGLGNDQCGVEWSGVEWRGASGW